MSLSFTHQATVTASTKRNALVSGERTGYTTNLASLSIMPLCPIDSQRAAELRQLLKLDTAYRLLETFAQGNPDVLDGDLLVIGTKEYNVRAVLPWTFGGDVRVNLVCEELKK